MHSELKSRRFRKLNVSGTFDLLHGGHELLFQKSFELSDKVLVGLTSDNLVKQLSKPHPVTPYEMRLRRLKKFLKARGWLTRVKVIPIDSVYGFAPDLKDLEAIVTSQETRKRASAINRKRAMHGFRPLEIIVVRSALADNGKPISVTRIKAREIDIHGRVVKEKASVGHRR